MMSMHFAQYEEKLKIPRSKYDFKQQNFFPSGAMGTAFAH